MEITCSLVQILGDENTGLSKGVYLNIISDIKEVINVFVSHREFMKTFRIDEGFQTEFKPGNFLQFAEQNVNQSLEIRTLSQSGQMALGLVLKSMGVNNLIVLNDDLTITSNFPPFLELPWESILSKSNCVFRKTLSNKGVETKPKSNSIGIFMSHAHEGVGKDLKFFMDQEVKSIVEALMTNSSTFRTDKIFMMKHTNPNSILELSNKKLTMLHFIMHGDENGDLCLEIDDPVNYKIVEKFSQEKLLKLMDGQEFNLIFMSMCYSGGGQIKDESIAFRLVSNGLSSNVISFIGPVGEESAKEFSEIFYNILTCGYDLKKVYKESLVRYKEKDKQKRYSPVLYTNV